MLPFFIVQILDFWLRSVISMYPAGLSALIPYRTASYPEKQPLTANTLTCARPTKGAINAR